MAEAMIRILIAKERISPEGIVVSVRRVERREYLSNTLNVNVTPNNRATLQDAEVVIIAVDPQHMPEVFADLRGYLAPDQTVLSIAAGVKLATLSGELQHPAIIRVMPNAPTQVGEGMAVWTATPAVTEGGHTQAKLILSALGQEIYAADENYLDMATALSGSGPAYLFLYLEAMIDAGVHLGFDRLTAQQLVLQTVLGSVQMAQTTGVHPAQLRNMVTSPGGTTAAALRQFEDGHFRDVILRAVLAAYDRSQELGRRGERVSEQG